MVRRRFDHRKTRLRKEKKTKNKKTNKKSGGRETERKRVSLLPDLGTVCGDDDDDVVCKGWGGMQLFSPPRNVG